MGSVLFHISLWVNYLKLMLKYSDEILKFSDDFFRKIEFYHAWETRPHGNACKKSLILTNHSFHLEPFPYKIVQLQILCKPGVLISCNYT